jgi:hypothetical protein
VPEVRQRPSGKNLFHRGTGFAVPMPVMRIRRLPAYVALPRTIAGFPPSIPQIGGGMVFNGRDTKITTAALICRSPKRKLRLYLVR